MRKIKIGGIDVSIKIDAQENLPGLFGDFSHKINQIRICQCDQSRMECTLLHEIIEWLDAEHNLGMKHRQVQSLAAALYEVLKDNNIWQPFCD